MRRLDLGGMPNGTIQQKLDWVRDKLAQIARYSRRDDEVTELAAKMATVYGEEAYNPPSLNAGDLDAIGAIAVPGAVLGDIVDASFSVDMEGVVLRAWVSATDVVSYQFHNVTAGVVNLGAGTVRVRAWGYRA